MAGERSETRKLKTYYQDDYCTIYHGDCRTVLLGLTGQMACVITDPPYNVGIDYGEHDDEMKAADYHAWMYGVFGDFSRLTDTAIWFPGKVGLLHVNTYIPLHWDVKRILGYHRRSYAGDKWHGGPAHSWEPIVWASSEGRPFYNKCFGPAGRDFLVIGSKEPKKEIAHPCPKPLQVMSWLVGLFTGPNATILDPFMGSGTTLVAAKALGRKAIGIEQEEKFCKEAVRRLRQESLQFAAG